MSEAAARWRRLEAVVQSALERPVEQRAAFLAEACGGDEDLRREAAALLDRDARAERFLAVDVGRLAADAVTYSPGGTPRSRDPQLAVGDKVGPYEIRARLGAGGMGEVYRAVDHSLGREVAIKLLPAIFSSDPERLARFEREARLLASLAHPHIGAIYGLQQTGDLRAIVLELIEGETLEERLRRGALSVDQALSAAVQIADALDHAHRRGVTHRDLKPANIMMTRTGARLLDFGLARWSGHASGFVNKADAAKPRPEGVESLTLEGTILGTPQYMAPEQLEGRPVDARADVFAFGAVLYEMLSAKQAFDGGSTAAVMAAVLNTEPSFAALPPVPPPVERVIRKCLAKDAEDRWQSTRDLSDELKWIATTRASATSNTVGSVSKPRSLRRVGGIAALTAIVIGAAGWGAWTFGGSRDTGGSDVMRFSIPPQGSIDDFAISNDGTTVAFTQAIDGIAANLFIRRLDQFEASPVPGGERAHSPIFSPDGKWVAFFSEGRLLKVNIETSAAPILLADLGPDLLDGGQWLTDGTIIFSRPRSGLQRIADTGGEAYGLTELNQSPRETDHHNPVMLPGGDSVLFTVHDSDRRFHVAVETLSTRQRKVVVESAYDARYLPSGHLVYARGGVILAAPFDLRTLATTGSEVTLIEDVGGVAVDGEGGYQISSNGTLIFFPVPSARERKLAWVDRSGAETVLPLPPRQYHSPSVSPDGRQIAYSVTDVARRRDIYIYDVVTGREVRFTRAADNRSPIWSRDGVHLTYSAAVDARALTRNLVRERVDQSGAPELLASGGPSLVPSSWTARDERLLFTDGDTGPDGTRILTVTSAEPHRIEPIADGPREERQPSVSPNGRWLAFTSNETGRTEVYVNALAGSSKPRQLSLGGGRLPKWSKDGREVAYRNGSRTMAIAMDPERGIAVGRPRALFEGSYVIGFEMMGMDSDLAPDGRFLMIKPSPEESGPQPLRVVVNWAAELRARIPAGR